MLKNAEEYNQISGKLDFMEGFAGREYSTLRTADSVTSGKVD